MKKRSDYNKKAWYRLIKVLFVGFYLVVSIFSGLIATDGAKWRELDEGNTTITCGSTEKGTEEHVNFSAAELPVRIEDYDFKNGSFQYKEYFQKAISEYNYDANALNLEKILNICLQKTENPPVNNIADVLVLQRMKELKTDGYSYEEARAKISEETSGITSHSDFFDKLTFNSQLFQIDPNYKYFRFMWALSTSLFIVLFTFELVRRLFYYILCGSFFLEDYKPVIAKLKTAMKKLHTTKA